MKKLLSALISGVVAFSSVSVLAGTAKEPDNSLWEKFLKYDLGITDYSSLSAEDKALCHYIFDTEQAAGDNIVCERARRILAGDDVGERVTLAQLENAYGLWDSYSYYRPSYGWQNYIQCVPDIVYLDANKYNELPMEYWLDDTGETYVIFVEKNEPATEKRFEVYDREDGLIQTIKAAAWDTEYKDMRCLEEDMERNGFIYKNGGWYYTKPDGTAVFAWSDHSGGESEEKITEPFVIESEINGCPVTAIEHGALAQTPFTEIVLPDPLEFIDRDVFADCQYLTKINFPEGLKYIGKWAFLGCNSLTDLTLDCPELVIADGAFYNLQSLKTAYINVNDIGERAVSYCESLESVTLGDSVENIGSKAFWSNILLTKIDLPSSVRTVGQGALVNFTSVTIPPTVEVLGSFPHKTPQELLSGLEPPPPIRPLTDDPIGVFGEECIVYGYRGTEAERYANEWGLEFQEIGTVAGDVNIDGKVNMADAVSLQRYLLGRYVPTGAYYGDLTGDGNVNVYDMIALKEELTK